MMLVKAVVILMLLNLFIISIGTLNILNPHIEKADSLTNLIRNDGYSVQTYNTWTEDGYRIRLHRVIFKKSAKKYRNPNILSLLNPKNIFTSFLKTDVSQKKTYSIKEEPPKEPILLVHGLFCSGSMWIANSSNSLAYLLSDAGYDVWLMSARGTSFAMQHKRWDSKTSKFWDFSWHEIGFYDVTRSIDFILAKTRKKSLRYVGHSQGTTAFIVAMTTRPKYNKKVSVAYLLAPAAYLKHAEGLVGSLTSTRAGDNLAEFFKQTNTYFLHLRQTLLVDSIVAFCQDPNINVICSQGIYTITGPGSEQSVDVFNMVISLVKTVVDNASVKQLMHFLQLIRSGTFQHFDYGREKNKLYYNNENPPAYNMSLLEVPLICISLTKDAIVTQEDVKKLLSQFNNVVRRHITIPGNHVDFLFDPKAINLIKNEIISYS